jgi:hypothetical protein
MMNRREALQLLATGTALQLAPAKMLAALREARAVLADQNAPRTLNAHQDATVRTMTEMILPRTETPGAADVGAGEFIDLMLTEWYEEAERARFLGGLADVDTRSQNLFQHNFVDCTSIQRAAILNALGEQMTEDELTRDQTTAVVGPPPAATGSFYSMLRWLTLTAYYTSEAGATQELHFEIIPDRHAGCVEVTLRSEGSGTR